MGRKFSVTETALIDRPVEQVFAYATDYRNDVYWRQGVTKLMLSPEGPSGEGSHTKEEMHAYGRTLVTEAIVTGFMKNLRADFRAISGPMPQLSGSRIFEARGSQTLVTYHLEGELDPFFSLIWPLMRGSFHRQIAGDLRCLKQLLEIPARDPAPYLALE